MALTGAGAAYVALVEDSALLALRPLVAAAERPAEAADGADGADDEPEDPPVVDEEAEADDAGVARPLAHMLQVQGRAGTLLFK